VIDPDSRYARLAETPLAYRDGLGREIRYLPRRFLAPFASFETLTTVEVQQGDRLDLIAARTLGAAEAWWRIAETNEALDPRTLTETPDSAQMLLEGGAPPVPRLRVPIPSG
jgi:hypothetical protein